MMETARAWLGNLTVESLIKFGKTFGVFALFTLILIGGLLYFSNVMLESQQSRESADAAERASRLEADEKARQRSEERVVKDMEARQRLFEKMVDSGIKRDEAMTLFAVQTSESLHKLEAIAERQVGDHTSLMDAQRMALKKDDAITENQTKILEGIGKDCDATKELIAIQRQIRDALSSGQSKPKPVPAPKSGGT